MSHMNYAGMDFNAFGAGSFPGFVGVEIVSIEGAIAAARMEIKKIHFAPNGYLHAGSIVTLADTVAGYGCLCNLPPGATSFTTIELKSNFLGSAKESSIKAEARLEHAGKTTQIWDVIVSHETSGKKLALFRCTQLLLY
jgi:1,4-dihydroxy-2-naphthoyl-CoA hydrolase